MHQPVTEVFSGNCDVGTKIHGITVEAIGVSHSRPSEFIDR